MNLDCSVVSCVLQSPNQTRVNVNFSSPAGAVEERADAEGRGAVAPAGSRPAGAAAPGALPEGRSVSPGCPRPAGGSGSAPPARGSRSPRFPAVPGSAAGGGAAAGPGGAEAERKPAAGFIAVVWRPRLFSYML